MSTNGRAPQTLFILSVCTSFNSRATYPGKGTETTITPMPTNALRLKFQYIPLSWRPSHTSTLRYGIETIYKCPAAMGRIKLGDGDVRTLFLKKSATLKLTNE